MCMEDIRIGRKIKTTFRYVALSATAAPIVKPNPNRVFIMIGVPSTNPAIVGPDSSVSLTAGISIFNTSKPLLLTVKKHGDIVIKGLWGITFPSATVGIIEGFLEEK
jgi:hypothetical protein